MIIRRQFDRDIARFTHRQMDAIRTLDSGRIKYLLFGGALAGGKSYLLRWYGLRQLLKFGSRGIPATVMLCAESYPVLQQRQVDRAKLEFPSWIGEFKGKNAEGEFKLFDQYGGGKMIFRNLDDPQKYRSVEFATCLVDELTLNPYPVFEELRQRLRWPGIPDHECQFVAGSNPTGIGMSWVKQFFVDRNLPKEFSSANGSTTYADQFAFIRSLAVDNPYIPAEYEAQMSTYPEEIQKALRYGRWDVFAGQAFPEITMETHGLAPLKEIPSNWPVFMTFDYGYGVPFSVGWWACDNDGRIIRFNEWYGWNGKPNQGLNMPDKEIAMGILEREREMGIADREITRYAGHDCGSAVPNRFGHTKGKSAVESFAECGVYLTLSDPDRLVGVRQFRQRIKTKIDDRPMLMATTNCQHFFRTLPLLTLKPANKKHGLEDIDEGKRVEDHVYDECRMILCARPMPDPEWDTRIETGNVWNQQEIRLQALLAADKGSGGPPIYEFDIWG